MSPLRGLRATFVVFFSVEIAEKLLMKIVPFEGLEILQPALERVIE